jgi:hypothetical protein
MRKGARYVSLGSKKKTRDTHEPAGGKTDGRLASFVSHLFRRVLGLLLQNFQTANAAIVKLQCEVVKSRSKAGKVGCVRVGNGQNRFSGDIQDVNLLD